MEVKNSFTTAVESIDETISVLKANGYEYKFRKEPDCLFCIDLYRWIRPDQFDIAASFLFREHSNPDGDRMIYAISTVNGIKGILVDTCGVYADNMSPEMTEKLSMRFNQQPVNSIYTIKEEKLAETLS